MNINQRNMSRFRRFVDEEESKDLHLHGRRYTWSNERANPMMEKLDCFLVSTEWEELFLGAFLQALSFEFSDHAPLLLSTDAATHSKRWFHFEKF